MVDRELPPITAALGSAIGTMYGALVDWVVRYWHDELGRDPQPGQLEPRTEALWRGGQHVSAGEMLMAHTRLQEYSRELAAAYENLGDGFDLWLTPTVGTSTPRLGELVTTATHDAKARASSWISQPLVIANLTGRAAMSVPLWIDAEGLPFGIHLLGTAGGEATLLQLATELERARPWHQLWPPVSAPNLMPANIRR
jgi:amidase